MRLQKLYKGKPAVRLFSSLLLTKNLMVQPYHVSPQFGLCIRTRRGEARKKKTAPAQGRAEAVGGLYLGGSHRHRSTIQCITTCTQDAHRVSRPTAPSFPLRA